MSSSWKGRGPGKLGYRAADGRPLGAPVWFVIEGGRLVFNTGKDTAKGRALARDPRVAICVDLERPPFAYVQIQGVAELSKVTVTGGALSGHGGHNKC